MYNSLTGSFTLHLIHIYTRVCGHLTKVQYSVASDLVLIWPPLTPEKMIWVGAGQVVYSGFIRAKNSCLLKTDDESGGNEQIAP